MNNKSAGKRQFGKPGCKNWRIILKLTVKK
jgi:hypothetical protein